MADVSHIGRINCCWSLKNPFDYGFDIVTTTTHKSLRGPRAGLILCKKRFAEKIDKSVFPGFARWSSYANNCCHSNNS